MCHVVFSCQVTLIAWFGLHHVKYLKDFQPTARFGRQKESEMTGFMGSITFIQESFLPCDFHRSLGPAIHCCQLCQPLGTDMCQSIAKFWIYLRFLFWEGRYLRLLENTLDTWNYWYSSPNLFSKPPSRGSRFHHSQLLSRVVQVSKRVTWNKIRRLLWNLPVSKNN